MNIRYPIYEGVYRILTIVQPVMPDKLPDELPDNVLQWYRKPFRKINRNPEQSRFRPVVMAEQTEMQPSAFLFQIDTL